jgi:hypothetical protein
MDKIFDFDIDGLDVSYKNCEYIMFFYNGESMNLKLNSHFKYCISFTDIDLKLKNISKELIVKNGLLYYIESLLKLKYDYLNEQYLKIKNLISDDIIQPSSYNDKIISKYFFNIKIKNNYPGDCIIHHNHLPNEELKFKLYLNEMTLKWRLSYDFCYLTRTITTNDILEEGIMYQFHAIIQRNYEYEYFPDFEDDY